MRNLESIASQPFKENEMIFIALLTSLTLSIKLSAIRVIFSLLLTTLTALLSTAGAAPVVGTDTINIVDASRGRTLTTEIWFQASAGTQTQGVSLVLPIAPIQIAPKATPSPEFKKRPLIVISHGNWGTRFSQGWIAMRLVQAGYAVISPSHPGTMNGDRSTAGAIRLWDRSQDVSFVLSAVLKDPRWAALIDTDRIGFWGHSFGGWTGVSLAGGRYDFKQLQAACEKQTPKDMYCQGMASEDLSKISLEGSQSDYSDSRIKAYYLTATGPGSSMTKTSLQQIRSPMKFDTAQFDEVLAPTINSTFLAATISGATEIVRPVGHFVYVPLCKPFIGKVVASLICSDTNGVDRADFHQKIAADTLSFFDKHLASTK
jgi:predicted dienelactone hydrolase